MVDMHMHTLYSDSDKTVEEVLKKCEEKNIKNVSKLSKFVTHGNSKRNND